MYRSPQELRSGRKGQPVPLSDNTDKQKLQLLSDSPISTTKKTMAPGGTDKTVKPVSSIIDPTVLETAVHKYLSSEDIFKNLVSRITEELKGVIEAAVQTAMTTANTKIATLHNEITSLTERLKVLDQRLVDRTDELEQYQRRNNIRIFGVSEATDENTDTIVKDICREKLGVELPEGALCRTHRVGKKTPPVAGERERHRPIIVRFVSYQNRRLVFGAKKKLRGTGITIKEDLTANRLGVYKAAVEKHGLNNTWTQDGRVLWVDKKGAKGAATTLADLAPVPEEH